MFLLHYLHHIALVIALIPGSLIFILVGLWRILRVALWFSMPPMPIRSASGSIVYTEANWLDCMRDGFPIRFAVFETFPRWIRQKFTKLATSWRIRT